MERLIARANSTDGSRASIRYFDKGSMAVVGRTSPYWRRTPAYERVLTWLQVFLHIMSLPQLQNRLRVQIQWLWSYFSGQRSCD